MTVIGIQRRRYNEVRNILSLAGDDIEYRLIASDFTGLSADLQAELERIPIFRSNAVAPVGDPEVKCHHYFNSIPLTDVDFICSLETSVPRWYKVEPHVWELGLAALASDRCRRLFALSQNAGLITDTLIRRQASPQQARSILEKMEVLYPPQSVFDEAVASKFTAISPLRLIFVGASFLRKGGYELLRAFDRVAPHSDFELTLISMLQPPPGIRYGWEQGWEGKLAESRAIIARHPNRIRHFPRLNNDAVLGELRSSHIALLPSYHDTFGYFTLEAQAAYCPVVTTNQRAFPEVNNDDIGWILPLPLDSLGRVESKDWNSLSRVLEDELASVLRDVATLSGTDLQRKAVGGVNQLRQRHDPFEASAQVRPYY